jgi:hypothetical protein
VHREVMVLLTFNSRYGVDEDVTQLHLSIFSAHVKRPSFSDPHQGAVFFSRFSILDKAVKRFFLIIDWHETVLAEIILTPCPVTVHKNFFPSPGYALAAVDLPSIETWATLCREASAGELRRLTKLAFDCLCGDGGESQRRSTYIGIVEKTLRQRGLKAD